MLNEVSKVSAWEAVATKRHYVVLKGVLDLTQMNINKFLDETFATYRTRGARIFNGGQQDNKRWQIELDTSPTLVPIHTAIDTIMSQSLVERAGWSTLISEDGCDKQTYHSDYNRNHSLVASCFGVIVALMKSTRFYILEQEPWTRDTYPETLVIMNPGDVLVFRGDCLHAGADYVERNTRVHYYFDCIAARRVPGGGNVRVDRHSYDIEPDEAEKIYSHVHVGNRRSISQYSAERVFKKQMVKQTRKFKVQKMKRFL